VDQLAAPPDQLHILGPNTEPADPANEPHVDAPPTEPVGSPPAATPDLEAPPVIVTAEDGADGGTDAPPAPDYPELDDLDDLDPSPRDQQTPVSEHTIDDPSTGLILPVHTDAPALRADYTDSPDGVFRIRDAGPADLKFIDSLQKTHGWQVGFMPLAWLRKCLDKDLVTLLLENGQPAAYLLARSKYKGRDDVGIIYQACVCYDAQRRTVGTALVEHHLNRFPPSTKLVGLWCAQDLDANLFWQASGFSPIAYRSGSRSKGRIHIYWQRRLDPAGAARFWYPESTAGGPMKESRIVTPITAADPWAAPKKIILPEPSEALAAKLAKRSAGRIDRSAAAELERQRAAFLAPTGSAAAWWNGNRRVPLDLAQVRARQGSMIEQPRPD